eukprot:470659-Rhodomonas_salina.2
MMHAKALLLIAFRISSQIGLEEGEHAGGLDGSESNVERIRRLEMQVRGQCSGQLTMMMMMMMMMMRIEMSEPTWMVWSKRAIQGLKTLACWLASGKEERMNLRA